MDIKKIREIRESFPKEIIKTSFCRNKRLSDMYSANVYLKNEDEQLVRSYKIRGSFNKINKLSVKERRSGLVCASAGNHSQGFALCCKLFKTKGTVFMPTTTPSQKIKAVSEFGGKYVDVKIVGDFFDTAYIYAKKFCASKKMTFVHPFNDKDIIDGQATVGLEILEQFALLSPDEKIDYMFVPVGGGGLISGISQLAKKIYPKIKIIGIEPKGASSAHTALKHNKIVELKEITSFVDGASVKKIGSLCFPIIKKYVDSIDLIDENRLCSSILYFLEKEGKIIEPAGILSIDALKDYKGKIKEKNVVCVISGSNFDFDRLSEVKERSLKFEGLKKYIVCEFPQRPGALKEFLTLTGNHMDITRFEYLKTTNKEQGSVFIGLETARKKDFDIFFKKLKNFNMSFRDVTHDQTLFDLLV